MKISSLLCLPLLSAVCLAVSDGERDALFEIPPVEVLPIEIEPIAETREGGVRLREFYFNGAPFNGAPTRIHAFYATPESAKAAPGVVQLHGSGLQTLKPDAAVAYAKAGYACISIDWAGPDWRAVGEIRPEPRSDFRSVGNRAVQDPETKRWRIVPPEEDARANGVRFVRRAFQFLRAQPEVDASRLCLSAMSAGAQNSLVTLAYEPGVKAAALKYGSAFARELNWGGAYGPIAATHRVDPAGATRWLDFMDPRHGLGRIRAATLMLSGTDDIFYFMPAVLATWRAIPAPTALLMLPNDNHSQVSNEVVPRQWFDHVLGRDPGAWPKPGAISTRVVSGGVELSVGVSGAEPLDVSFWFKRMPAKTFRFGRGGKDEATVRWESIRAQKEGDSWVAILPAPADDEQLVAYAMVGTATGLRASSDTLELPAMARWGRDVR